jgi:hypothetical protein
MDSDNDSENSVVDFALIDTIVNDGDNDNRHGEGS